MKPSFFVLTIFFLLISYQSFSQEPQITERDSVVSSSWMFGLGFNAVDDAGSEFSDIFNIRDNWNIVPFPSRLSIGKYFKNGLGVELIGSYNVYKEGKNVDGAIVQSDIDYMAIDIRASYDLNKILGETGWFDPYVGIGLGYTDANNQGRGTYNATVGFRTWLSDRIGLDFNSTGKWAMSTENASNHLQHAIGVVYRFKYEKELSSKGLEKMAILQALEEEQNRVNDSIAEVERKEAALLAEQNRKAEEAIALKNENERKLATAQEQTRQKIEQQIKDLGFVYFDLNSSYLNDNDKELLIKLAGILNDNPEINIDISSHTDSRGENTYNLWLSERRLERIISFLTSKGIEGNRIQGEAFGEKQLTNDCYDGTICNEAQHQANRRCEFKVITNNDN